jgi:hypothetical protein
MNKVFGSKRPILTLNLLAAVKKQNNSILWILAVAFGALAPVLRVLLSGHTLVWRDTSKLFLPIRYLVVEALRDFRLPLWNPVIDNPEGQSYQ